MLLMRVFLLCVFFFFFFQAEDGIRDWSVTGVQTCALPIFYEFACTHVPRAMADCLDKAGVSIDSVKKIFIHQANEKMDEAIINRFYRIYKKPVPDRKSVV